MCVCIQTCPKERYTDVASNGSSPVTDQNWIQYLLYLNQLWYIFIWNSHLVEQVFDFLKEKCFTWICLDWGLNPGPPALEASTIPLGYRGGGYVWVCLTALDVKCYIMILFVFQVAHMRYFIFFRLQMGLMDNIIAKCKSLECLCVIILHNLTAMNYYEWS